MQLSHNDKLVIPGGAGLVGQNLVTRLLATGYSNIVVLDKHRHNLNILQRLHPSITTKLADLSKPGEWTKHFEQSKAVIMLQAQIGAKLPEPFVTNNVRTTEHVLAQIKHAAVPYLVHISSSVVNSVANDDYTRTKREQEALVVASGAQCVVLRPTLMFGWFDRKHLGWLAQFMRRVPIFPIPGRGRIPRQPLYVGDFCAVIMHCLREQITGTYDISGVEFVDYVDIIRTIRKAIGARALILPIPFSLFDFLLKTWALIDKDPPFTSAQLHALVAADKFEVTDWPNQFGVSVTPFADAIEETFTDEIYSSVELKF